MVVRLDGQTAHDAISTLQALPPDAVLECHHGYYDVEADVMQTVPMTNVTRPVREKGVSHRYCTVVQRGDGYGYSKI